MNYFHQTRSTVQGQAPGFPQRAWIVEADWIAQEAPYLGSTGADAITFDGAHSLVPGKGWIQLYSLPHTVQAAFRNNSSPGALHGMWEPEMFWPGDHAALQQMAEQLQYGDYVLLLEDREAGSNKFIQFGTKSEPIQFKTVEYDSGKSDDGVKGWKIVGYAARRRFYDPGTNLGLHPDTIIFLNQLFFAEGIELTMEQELILDRLVRDLHGESNPDYDTYDIWALGVALYPYIGGTADAHKYNLFDPQDTDAAFRITWTNGGGLVHDAGGNISGAINWDGASFGNTHIVPDTVFGLDEGCHGVFIRKESNTPNEYGVSDSTEDNFLLKLKDGSDTIYFGVNSKNQVSVTDTNIPLKGAFTVNRPAGGGSMRVYADGTVQASVVDVAHAKAAISITVGKINGENSFTTSRVNGHWFFHGLPNNPHVIALNNAVTAYNVALGRY